MVLFTPFVAWLGRAGFAEVALFNFMIGALLIVSSMSVADLNE